jgi:hypothetical protein
MLRKILPVTLRVRAPQVEHHCSRTLIWKAQACQLGRTPVCFQAAAGIVSLYEHLEDESVPDYTR